MRKTITAAAVAASLAAGGLVGAVVGTPALAGAAETAAGAVGWVEEALGGLVDDGTIDQSLADAVASALTEARPERGFGHHLLGGLTSVAESLGVTRDELRTAVLDGRTIAEIAADEGIDVQVVVDAIVAAQQEHLDEEVAEGDLTQARADELVAGAEERATALVDGDLGTLGRGGHGHGGGGHHGGGGFGRRGAPATSEDTSA